MRNEQHIEPATPALIIQAEPRTARLTAPSQESEPHSVATIQDAADAEIKRIQKERNDLGARHSEYAQELMQLREKMVNPALSPEEMEKLQQRESALDKLRVNVLWRDEELQREFGKAGERRLRVDDERERYKRLAQDLRIAINQSFAAEQDAINRQRIVVRERDAAQKELQRLETEVLPQYGDVRITPLQNMPLTDRRS
jgi:vacuolar-type H+-ATPase subunit E/Vma4